MPSPPSAKSSRAPALLLGVALLALPALWLTQRTRLPEADRAVVTAPAPAAAAPPNETAASVEPLSERIRAAVARAADPVHLTVPLLDPFGAPLTAAIMAELSAAPLTATAAGPQVTTTPGALRLTAPRHWPAFPPLRVSAAGFAPRLLRALPLGAGDMTIDPIHFSPGATLRGRAFGPGDQPLPSRRVVLWDVNGRETDRAAGRTLPLDTTTTDLDGGFTFAHCASRMVRCELEGGDGLATTLLADAVAGERPIRLDARSAAAPILGQVATPAGEPIAGAIVVATMAGPRERSARRVTTDRDGRFALDLLARGYYAVTAEAPGRLPVVMRRVHSGTGGLVLALESTGSAELELLGAPAGVDLPLLWRLLDGLDPRRRPTTPFATARLRDGRVTIAAIPPGRHALELRLPGAAPLTTDALAYDAGRTTLVGSLTLTAGATLSARVVDAQGQPLSGRAALAAAFQAGHVVDRDVFALPDHEEHALAPDGSLQWDGLPAGWRSLAVRAEGCADHTQAVELADGRRLDLGTIRLPAAGAIDGVVRRLSGVPLGDATVVAERVGGSRLESITLADGSYRFDRLLPGRWELRLLPSDDETTFLLDGALPAADPAPVLLDVVSGTRLRRELSLGR